MKKLLRGCMSFIIVLTMILSYGAMNTKAEEGSLDTGSTDTTSDTTGTDTPVREAKDDDLSVKSIDDKYSLTTDTKKDTIENNTEVSYKLSATFEGTTSEHQKYVEFNVPNSAQVTGISGSKALGVNPDLVLETDQETLVKIKNIEIKDESNGDKHVTYTFNDDVTEAVLEFKVKYASAPDKDISTKVTASLSAGGKTVTKSNELTAKAPEKKAEATPLGEIAPVTRVGDNAKSAPGIQFFGDHFQDATVTPDGNLVDLNSLFERAEYTTESGFVYSTDTASYQATLHISADLADTTGKQLGDTVPLKIKAYIYYDDKGNSVGAQYVYEKEIPVKITGIDVTLKATGERIAESNSIMVPLNAVIDENYLTTIVDIKTPDNNPVIITNSSTYPLDTSIPGRDGHLLFTVKDTVTGVEKDIDFYAIVDGGKYWWSSNKLDGAPLASYGNSMGDNNYYTCYDVDQFDTLLDKLKECFYGVNYEYLDPQYVELSNDGGYAKNYNKEDVQNYIVKYELTNPETGSVQIAYIQVKLVPKTITEISYYDGAYGVNNRETFNNPNYSGHLSYLSNYMTGSGSASAILYKGETTNILNNPDLFLAYFDRDISYTTYNKDGPVYKTDKLSNILQSITFDTSDVDLNTVGYNKKIPMTMTFKDELGGETVHLDLYANIVERVYKQLITNVDVGDTTVALEDCVETSSTAGKMPATVLDDGGYDVNKEGTYKVTYCEHNAPYSKRVFNITVGPLQFSGVEDKTIVKGTNFDLLSGIDCTNNEDDGVVPVTVKDNGGFNKDIPGTYTITYSATNPKTNVEYTATRVITVIEDSISFTAKPDITIAKGADIDLKEGVTAKSKNDVICKITVDNDGGFDKDVPGTYTVTYKATHPGSGESITGTRTITVENSTSSSVIDINLSATNAVVKQPSDFVMGGYGQELFVMQYDYEADINKTGRRLEIHVPEGFELVQAPTLNMALAPQNGTSTGSYDSEGGTTVYWDFEDGANVQASFTVAIRQKIDVLWKNLSNDINDYDFTIASYENKTTKMKQKKVTLSTDGQIPDYKISQPDYESSYNPGQLFDENGRGFSSNPYYSNQEMDSPNYKPYNIVVEKEAGKLPAKDFTINLEIPNGLKLYGSKIACSVNGVEYQQKATVQNNDGKITVSFDNSTSTTFNSFSNYGSKNHTFIETMRDTDKIAIKLYFYKSNDWQDYDDIKINNTTDQSDPDDEGYMVGSRVTINETDRNSNSLGVTKTSDKRLKFLILNGKQDLKIAEGTGVYRGGNSGSVSNINSDFKVGMGKTIYHTQWLYDKTYNTLDYSSYRDVTVTTTYDYEYSPIKISYDPFYMNMYYTVSNKDGIVPGKEKVLATTTLTFDLADGEYVSSTSYTFKDKYAADINNANGEWYGIFNYKPLILCKAKDQHIDGEKLTEDFPTTVSTAITGKFIKDALNVDRIVTVSVLEDNMEINANKLSDNVRQTIDSSNTGSDFISIKIKRNSKTMVYDNPRIAIVGDAVKMADINNIGPNTQVVALSVDPNAKEDGSGEWITDPNIIKIIKGNNGEFQGKPVTGMMVDLEQVIANGASSDNPNDYDMLYIYSKKLWPTSPGFSESTMEEKLNDHGSASLDYKIGFISDDTAINEDTGAIVGSKSVKDPDGKTSTYPLGKMVDYLTSKDNDYYVNPYAATTPTNYDLSRMELMRVDLHLKNDDKGSSYTGAHIGSCLEIKSDGTPESDALMSIAGGVSTNGYPSIQKVVYTTNKGATKTGSVSTSSEYKNENGTYSGYLPFQLDKDEYVTNVKIYYNQSGSRRNFEGVGLVANKAIPEISKTGYTFTDGEKLPYSATFTYDDYQTSGTEEDDPVILNLDSPLSAKIKIGADKLVETYSPTITSMEPMSVFQTNSFTVSANQSWSFEKDTVRIGVNTLTPTVYYKLKDDVYYISDSITGDAIAAYDDNTHVLKVVYKSPHASGDCKITFKIGTTYDTQEGAIYPIEEAYLDTSFDKTESVALYDYTTVLDKNSTQYVKNPSVKPTQEMLKANSLDNDGIYKSELVTKRQETGIVTYPTSTGPSPDGGVTPGQKNIGGPGDPVSGTSSSTYGGKIDMIGDITSPNPSSDWNLYLDIPKAGTTVQYRKDGTTKTSDPSDFSQELSGPITPSDDHPFPNGTVITYTTDSNASMNGLTTAGHPTESSTYLTAEQIAALGSDAADEFYKNVTCVHIYIPSLPQAEMLSFNEDFRNVKKETIGTQDSYGGVYYNYTDSNGNLKIPNGNYEKGPLMQYTLNDYYITGKVWKEGKSDNIYTGEDSLYAGTELEVVNKDGSAIECGPTVKDGDIKNIATSNDKGTYTVAVPNIGDYIVKVKKVNGINLVKEKDPAAIPTNYSYFSQKEYTTDIKMVDGLDGNTLTNINAGIYEVQIDADDFTYGIDEGSLTGDISKILSHLSGTDGTTPIDVSKITVDPTELAAINQSINDGKTAVFPLTYKYVYNDGGTPDDPSDDLFTEKTINVSLRDHGTKDEANEHITANDFVFTLDGSMLTNSMARKLSFVSATDKDGKEILATKLVVDETQKNKINNDIKNGIAKPGDTYPLKFTTPEGTSVEVTVTLKGEATNQDEQISANNFSYGIDEGTMSADTAKKLGQVAAVDELGFDIDPTTLKVDATTLQAINDALPTAKPGDTYPLTYSTPNGTSVTIQVELTKYGAGKEDGKDHIAGNDFDYAITDKDGKTTKDIDKDYAYILGDIQAIDKDGNPLYVDDLTVDEAQLKVINDHKNNGEKGTYPLTWTTPDGTKIITQVTLKDDGTNQGTDDKDQAMITANNFVYPIHANDGTENPDIDDALAKILGEVTARDKDDKERPLTDITVNADQLKVINDAKGEGKTGVYPLTYTDPDGKVAIIKVTLKDVGIPKDPDNQQLHSIAANNFSYGIHDSKGNVTPDIDDETAKNLASVVGTDATGNPLDLTGFTVDQDQLAKINADKNAGLKTTNPLTFTNPAGDKAVVQVTLKDVGSVDKENPVDEKNKAYITGNDFSYNIKDNDGKTNPDISKDLSKLLAKVDAKDKDGNPIDISKIKVDEAQLKEINDFKNKGFTGVHPLTFTTEDGEKVTINVTLKSTGENPDPGNQDQGFIGANDFIYAMKDEDGNFNPDIDDDFSKLASGVKALDEDGNPIDLTDITVDQAQLKVINDAKNAYEKGTYPLTFTDSEGKKAIINVTLKEAGTNVVKGNGSIGADNFTYSIVDGKGNLNKDLTDDLAKELGKVIALDKDGNHVDIKDIKVDQAQLKVINDAKNAGKKGSYPLTFTAPDGTKATIMVTLVGDYVKVIPNNNGGDNKQISGIKTGDAVSTTIFLVLLLTTLLGIITLKKKREE